MTHDEFMRYATHACNLSEDVLENLNWAEIRNLPATAEVIQQAVRLWSQYKSGNVKATAKEILAMDKDDQRRVLDTWIDITSDSDALRHIAKFIVWDITV
jgi:hypothetical protein